MNPFLALIRQFCAVLTAGSELANKVRAAAFSELSDVVMHEDQ
ncbi:MAG: hypothetical protein ACJA1J_003525 [Sulfitobacter pontiacus]|jgi:hypothetical protein